MKNKQQSGFSMIEVLMTIVVMAVGFLALLSLQLSTFNNLSASNQNFLAVSLATDMGERVRANIGSAIAYNNMNTSTFSKDCGSVACDLREMDIWQWKQVIMSDNQLPQGVGSITVLGGFATINISWMPKGATELRNYALQVSL
jgi:type IV pilus assembly protein PilV